MTSLGGLLARLSKHLVPKQHAACADDGDLGASKALTTETAASLSRSLISAG
jgi:hypothetical protein